MRARFPNEIVIRAKSAVRALEDRANRISDSDREWWPFGFLRPDPAERFSSLAVLFLTILCCVPATLSSAFLGRALGERVTTVDLFRMMLAVTAAFFVLYRSTFVFFWNRRADRLRTLEQRRTAWLRTNVDSETD